MTTLREAAQMALDALEQVQEADTAGATPKMVMEARKLYEPTITALRAALAQPEQEPQQREWQGLTDKEHEQIAIDCGCASADWVFYGAAVERKVKEKNT